MITILLFWVEGLGYRALSVPLKGSITGPGRVLEGSQKGVTCGLPFKGFLFNSCLGFYLRVPVKGSAKGSRRLRKTRQTEPSCSPDTSPYIAKCRINLLYTFISQNTPNHKPCPRDASFRPKEVLNKKSLSYKHLPSSRVGNL